MDNMEDYRDLSKEAYKVDKAEHVGDWHKIGSSRNVGAYRNSKTGEINQSIAGSHSISDFISDFFLGTLGVKDKHYRRRQHEAEEMAKKIDRIKSGSMHSLTGHSLAGNLSTNLIHKGLGDKAVHFNPYVTQHDMQKANIIKLQMLEIQEMSLALLLEIIRIL